MPIIFGMFTEPAEIIMQGEQFHFMPVLTVDNSHSSLFPDCPMILDNPVDQMFTGVIPNQISSWNEQWGWMNKTNKLSNSSISGTIDVTIGIQPSTPSLVAINANFTESKPNPLLLSLSRINADYMSTNPVRMQSSFSPLNTNIWVNPQLMWKQVDLTQEFLMSSVPIDMDGNWLNVDMVMPALPEISAATELEHMEYAGINQGITDQTLSFSINTVLPRAEIMLSKGGADAMWWAETLPANIGFHVIKTFKQTTIKQLLVGVTRDAYGAPLGNCTVYVFRTDNFSLDRNCFVASAVSDGSGNFSIQVDGEAKYQLTAYLAGSPDKAGVSITNITPTAG
jgi:hypothetical protein